MTIKKKTRVNKSSNKKKLIKREAQRAAERVAIAKDALEWIQAGALQPTKSVYVDFYDETLKRKLAYDPIFSKVQLRDVVLGPCQVCAKGALFLAKAVRFNNVLARQWDETAESCALNGAMLDHFDADQLALIEESFEGWIASVPGTEGNFVPFSEQSNPDYQATKCTYDYANQFPDITDRLVAILQNIIDNKGTFIPFPNG
jgi:hypothetical protein